MWKRKGLTWDRWWCGGRKIRLKWCRRDDRQEIWGEIGIDDWTLVLYMSFYILDGSEIINVVVDGVLKGTIVKIDLVFISEGINTKIGEWKS